MEVVNGTVSASAKAFINSLLALVPNQNIKKAPNNICKKTIVELTSITRKKSNYLYSDEKIGGGRDVMVF